MAKKAKRPSAGAMAKRAAAHLFSRPGGYHADRLVQVDKDDKPSGGWSESVVADVIAMYMKIHTRKVLRDRKRREPSGK